MTINSTPPISEIERTALPHREKQTQPDVPKKHQKAFEAEAEVVPKNPEKLKEVLAESDISLKFTKDEGTGRMVVEMIDNATGDAVRQIPNEVSLRLGEMFSKVQGQLFETRV